MKKYNKVCFSAKCNGVHTTKGTVKEVSEWSRFCPQCGNVLVNIPVDRAIRLGHMVRRSLVELKKEYL